MSPDCCCDPARGLGNPSPQTAHGVAMGCCLADAIVRSRSFARVWGVRCNVCEPLQDPVAARADSSDRALEYTVPQEGRGSQEGTAQAVTQPALPSGAVQQLRRCPHLCSLCRMPCLLQVPPLLAWTPLRRRQLAPSPALHIRLRPVRRKLKCRKSSRLPGLFEANRAKLAALLQARDKQKGKQVRKGKPAAAPACLAADSKVSALSSAQLSVPAAKKPAGLVKRRPSAVDKKKQTQKKGVQPKCTKETADTRRRAQAEPTTRPATWLLTRGFDDDRAKKAGRKAHAKALQLWDGK